MYAAAAIVETFPLFRVLNLADRPICAALAMLDRLVGWLAPI